MASPVSFVKETRDELKKVTWPTKQEVIRLTLTVIIVSVFVGFYLGAADYIFTKALELILK